MIEVEVKVKIKDRNQAKEKLLETGFLKGNAVKESDLYFDNSDNQIRNCDGALRVRTCENLTTGIMECFMTYKGPKMDVVSMTRKEFEIQIDNGQIAQDILVSLGFVKTYPVIKTRQYYHLNEVTACLDLVHDLGDFLELEIVVEQDAEKKNALEILLSIVKKLGFDDENMLRSSYLSMLQKEKQWI